MARLSRKQLLLILNFVIFSILLSCPTYATSVVAEKVFLKFYVNELDKGDFFCILFKDTILVKEENLKDAGITKVSGKEVIFENERWFDLKTIDGVVFEFDEKKLIVKLSVMPMFLEKQIIDLYPKRYIKPLKPEGETSFFLNYRLEYRGSDDLNFQMFSVANELGVNYKKFLFITEGSYEKKGNVENYVRLNSAVYRDFRDRKERIIIGDFVAPAKDFLGGELLGGISFSKNYNLDPYYIYKPTFDVKGAVPYRSEIQVLLDGITIRREYLQPGEFELKNLYYYGGERNIEVMIKDPFGRVERLQYPYYFADDFIKSQEFEYSYNFGFIRKNHGIESNNYAEPIIVFVNRYGLSNNINIGLGGEIGDDKYTLSPSASLFKVGLGALGMTTYLNKNRDSDGIKTAGILSYSYYKERFGIKANYTKLENSFQSISFDNKGANINFISQIGGSYYNQWLGSINLDVFLKNYFQKGTQKEIVLGYSKSFFKNTNFYATGRTFLDQPKGYEIFLGFSYYPEKEHTLSFIGLYQKGMQNNAVQLQKSAPIGEGLSYRISIENNRVNSSDMNYLYPYVEYRTPWNIITADIGVSEKGGKYSENYIFSASGALAYVNKHFGLTRPIDDSFALIKVDELKDIPILFENQVVAKTNKQGYVFVPSLNSYNDNRIVIETKNIPMNYDILKEKIIISPPYRYGACISFPINKIYRYAGAIKMREEDKLFPLENKKIKIKPLFHYSKRDETDFCGNGQLYEGDLSTSFYTFSDGEFYVENLLPGDYELEFEYQDLKYTYKIQLPQKDEIIINISDIVIPAVVAQKEVDVKKEKQVIEVKKEQIVMAPKEIISRETETIIKQTTPTFFEEELPQFLTLRPYFFFKFNSTKFADKEDNKLFEIVVNYLKRNKKAKISIEGHCDIKGTQKYNYVLGKKRAEKVKKELIKLGIDKERIIATVSYGKEKALCYDTKEACQKLNRRVEIRIFYE